MKKIIMLAMILIAQSTWAVTITQQGSDQMSYLTNGNSCWRACFKAVNKAKTRIQTVAGAHCPQGYKITNYPVCSWPASDPSFLDMDGWWPVCKCTDTCTASFECNTSGQKPSFFGNVANQWRQIRVFTQQHRQEVNQSYNDMRSIRNVGALLQAIGASAAEYNYNTEPFYEKLERGQVEYVQAPPKNDLLKEFVIPMKYPVTPVKPIRPVKPGTPIKKLPVLPGTPIKPIVGGGH